MKSNKQAKWSLVFVCLISPVTTGKGISLATHSIKANIFNRDLDHVKIRYKNYRARESRTCMLRWSIRYMMSPNTYLLTAGFSYCAHCQDTPCHILICILFMHLVRPSMHSESHAKEKKPRKSRTRPLCSWTFVQLRVSPSNTPVPFRSSHGPCHVKEKGRTAIKKIPGSTPLSTIYNPLDHRRSTYFIFFLAVALFTSLALYKYNIANRNCGLWRVSEVKGAFVRAWKVMLEINRSSRGNRWTAVRGQARRGTISERWQCRRRQGQQQLKGRASCLHARNQDGPIFSIF